MQIEGVYGRLVARLEQVQAHQEQALIDIRCMVAGLAERLETHLGGGTLPSEDELKQIAAKIEDALSVALYPPRAS
jgi:hypothetical protein